MSHAEERPSPGRNENDEASQAEQSRSSAAMREAKRAASNLAADANKRIAGLLDRQVETGADVVGHVASSFRAAADDLSENAPQLADFARLAAERIEDVSDAIRDQSAADLFDAASDFARRRPAIVFGATAVAGFLLYRVLSAEAPARKAAGRTGGTRQRSGSGGTARKKPARRPQGAARRSPPHGE